MDKITYSELKSLFRKHELENPSQHLTAHIVFTEDSFLKKYDLTSRTYVVSSYNKAYRPNMGGYSIFGDCLDGIDRGIRLENLMTAECGGDNCWRVEYCYLVE